MYAVSMSILIIFAVIGIIYSVREITYFLFKNRTDGSILIIAPIGKECEDAEYLLRGAAARVKWTTRSKDSCVICLDCNMSGESKRICEALCEKYGYIRLMSRAELFEMLNRN